MLAKNLKRTNNGMDESSVFATRERASGTRERRKTYACISQERTRELTLGLIVHPDITPYSPPVTVVIIEMRA
jgi:hypothetical protein